MERDYFLLEKKLNKAKVLDRVFSMAVPQEIYSQIEEELLAKK